MPGNPNKTGASQSTSKALDFIFNSWTLIGTASKIDISMMLPKISLILLPEGGMLWRTLGFCAFMELYDLQCIISRDSFQRIAHRMSFCFSDEALGAKPSEQMWEETGEHLAETHSHGENEYTPDRQHPWSVSDHGPWSCVSAELTAAPLCCLYEALGWMRNVKRRCSCELLLW